MAPLRKYLIMASHFDAGEAPRYALDLVSSHASPALSGSLVLAANPLPGLARELELLHELASGILVVTMTPDEAQAFRDHFSNLIVEEETFLPHADGDL